MPITQDINSRQHLSFREDPDDSTKTVRKVISINPDGSYVGASYSVNDIDEASSTITYLGKEKSDGTWLVQKIDTTTSTSFQYASEVNNASYTTYDTAWTARASLTYANYGDVT